MKRTHAIIANGIKSAIGQHYRLICSTPANKVTQEHYLRSQSESDSSVRQARYLAAHLVQLDSDEFLRACGITPN
jgi:hypothetical protein